MCRRSVRARLDTHRCSHLRRPFPREKLLAKRVFHRLQGVRTYWMYQAAKKHQVILFTDILSISSSIAFAVVPSLGLLTDAYSSHPVFVHVRSQSLSSADKNPLQCVPFFAHFTRALEGGCNTLLCLNRATAIIKPIEHKNELKSTLSVLYITIFRSGRILSCQPCSRLNLYWAFHLDICRLCTMLIGKNIPGIGYLWWYELFKICIEICKSARENVWSEMFMDCRFRFYVGHCNTHFRLLHCHPCKVSGANQGKHDIREMFLKCVLQRYRSISISNRTTRKVENKQAISLLYVAFSVISIEVGHDNLLNMYEQLPDRVRLLLLLLLHYNWYVASKSKYFSGFIQNGKQSHCKASQVPGRLADLLCPVFHHRLFILVNACLSAFVILQLRQIRHSKNAVRMWLISK